MEGSKGDEASKLEEGFDSRRAGGTSTLQRGTCEDLECTSRSYRPGETPMGSSGGVQRELISTTPPLPSYLSRATLDESDEWQMMLKAAVRYN